jgi:hypothetical protein
VACPKCAQRIIVPYPASEPLPGILTGPSQPAPDKEPPSLGEHEDDRPTPKRVGEDSDEIDVFLRRRRRCAKFSGVWRWLTLLALGTSLLGFFLPWVKLHLTLPRELRLPKSEIEVASQSGFQMAVADANAHQALSPYVDVIAEAQEKEWRRQGKNPERERLRERVRYAAPWLFVFPMVIVIAGLITLVAKPTLGNCVWIGSLTLAGGVLLLAHFTFSSMPLETAMYESAAKEFGADTLLAMSLYFDARFAGGLRVVGAGVVAVILLQVAQFAYLAMFAPRSRR